MSVPHLTSFLAGRFWIWPLWLPASFISSSFTAYLGSHCAMKSVTPRSIMTWAGCDPRLPGYSARQPLWQLDFQSLWTICWYCMQRRGSSVARPVLPVCKVISPVRQYWSCILSKCLQLPTDSEMNFVNFCPPHIWIPVVKFILQFYSGDPLNHVLV